MATCRLGLLVALVMATSAMVAARAVEAPFDAASLVMEDRTMLLELESGSCSADVLKAAAEEERVQKAALAASSGIGGRSASANKALADAEQEATTRLEGLMANAECAPFLADITPIAEVQKRVQDEAASAGNQRQDTAERFKKQEEADTMEKATKETAEKNSANNAKEIALKDEGAFGLLKESKEKQNALDEEAEDRYLEEGKERSAKTWPAMQKIFLEKKADLEKDFQIKLLSLRTHAAEEGVILLARSKESGAKAAYSPAVRKETRMKMRLKYEKEDEKRKKSQDWKLARILRQAQCSNEAVKKLSAVRAAQLQVKADRVKAAANDPNMVAKILMEETRNRNAKNRDDQERRTKNGEMLPGQIDPAGVKSLEVRKSIIRFNNALAGVLSETQMRQQEAAAAATPMPTLAPRLVTAGGSDNSTDNNTTDVTAEEDPLGGVTPTAVPTIAPTEEEDRTTVNSDFEGVWPSTGGTGSGVWPSTGSAMGSFPSSGVAGSAASNDTEVVDESRPETAAAVSGSITDWSAADETDSAIERINGHECKGGIEVQFFNDKCYTWAECAAACEEMGTCQMFETNGCQCKFYDQKVNPVAASGWTCGIKHLADASASDSAPSSVEVQLMESQPDVQVALASSSRSQSGGVQTLDLHLHPTFNPLRARPQS